MAADDSHTWVCYGCVHADVAVNICRFGGVCVGRMVSSGDEQTESMKQGADLLKTIVECIIDEKGGTT